jgi:predicted CoA-binding protein
LARTDVAEVEKALEALSGTSRRRFGNHISPLINLQRRGFRIIPVNPKSDEILGEKAYGSLADIPEPVDAVDVFQPADETPAIARQAVEIGAKTLWLQLGIRSEEARRIAEKGDLSYVEDRCMGTEAHLFDVTH